MKKYEKPIVEEIDIILDDIICTSLGSTTFADKKMMVTDGGDLVLNKGENINLK